MKEAAKEYNIDTLEKLCNVANKENVQRLAIDVAQWLIHYTLTIDQVREKYPKETKNKSNSKIAKGWFNWVDDGKNDLLHCTIENKDTGEITNVDIQQPPNDRNDEPSVATGDAQSDGAGNIKKTLTRKERKKKEAEEIKWLETVVPDEETNVVASIASPTTEEGVRSKEDIFKDSWPKIWDLCRMSGMGDHPGKRWLLF